MIGIDAYKNTYMQAGGANAFAGGGVTNPNNSFNPNYNKDNVFMGGNASVIRGTGAESTGSYGAVQGINKIPAESFVSKLDKYDEPAKRRQVKDAFRGNNLCTWA